MSRGPQEPETTVPRPADLGQPHRRTVEGAGREAVAHLLVGGQIDLPGDHWPAGMPAAAVA